MNTIEELLAALPSSPPPPGWSLKPSRKGALTASIGDKALCSRFDPVKEAQTLVQQVPSQGDALILAGYGLGYVAEALALAYPHRMLIIAEADPALLRAALQARPPELLAGKAQISFLAGGAPEGIKDLLARPEAGEEIHLIRYRPVQDLHKDWYDTLDRVVRETAERKLVNRRTLQRFGRLWVKNLAANAPMLSRALPLAPWENKLKDLPALILAGGPSLEAVLPHLGAIKKRVFLIAVDTALPAVLRGGVDPDVVAAVDPQYWNTRHLDRCQSQALILAESAAHPAVFRILSGRPWLTRTRFPLGSVLEDAAGIKGYLKAGGSVATAAWDLGRYLGCRPLYAAGLDLAYPGGKTHFAGSLARRRPLFLSHRLNPVQGQGWQALRDAGPYLAPDAQGGMVLTDKRMAVYAAWFRERTAENQNREPKRIGAEGLAIEGMANTSLKEILALPPRRREIDALLKEIKETPPDPQAPRRLSQALAMVRETMKTWEDLAREGLETAALLEKAWDAGRDINPLLAELSRVDQELLAAGGSAMVSFIIQPLIRELVQPLEGPLEPARMIEKSQRLYRELRDAARYHHRLFSRKETPIRKNSL